MDKSYGITQMSSRRFYSLPFKSVQNNKLLIRDFQNITSIKIHRVIQQLKTERIIKLTQSNTAPKGPQNISHSQENPATNFRQKPTTFYSKGVGET